jgi:hypothetical protein
LPGRWLLSWRLKGWRFEGRCVFSYSFKDNLFGLNGTIL